MSVEDEVLGYVRSAVGHWAHDATPQSRLDALGIDSFALFELLLGLEDRFGMTIKAEDFSIATFRTVGDMISYVSGELSDGSA